MLVVFPETMEELLAADFTADDPALLIVHNFENTDDLKHLKARHKAYSYAEFD